MKVPDGKQICLLQFICAFHLGFPCFTLQRRRARSSLRSLIFTGMLPASSLCESSRATKVLKAEKSRDSSVPLSRIPGREMAAITGQHPPHRMPCQRQGAEMFSQDRRASWLC
uniref:Uncharacterized protein n=2 Tax=Triticum urartu TaxID=4572 RepID=A0A8R7UJT0_TRIUA